MRCLAFPIRRPVGTAAAYVGLVAVAVAALPGLPLGLSPDLELPRLSVEFQWPGASPEAMESLVTSSIEADLAALPGVDGIASTSGSGWGWVDLSFRRGTRMDVVDVLVRERLAALREFLPEDLPPPTVTRSVPESVDPGSFFAVQLHGPRTPEALRAELEDRVLPALAAVDGVTGALAYGGARAEIRVEVPRGEAERGVVSTEGARRALDDVGPGRSLGAWRTTGREIPLSLDRPEPSAASIRARGSGRDDLWLPLGDVTRVVETWEEPRSLARIDGKPSVQGLLERAPGTNVMRVAADVRERLEELRSTLPAGLELEILHDESESIGEELALLGRRAAMSLGLILGVLLIARQGVRSALVILSSVALSALVTFLLFRATGLGLNLVTLSGLALAFGMAVDNSIVLLENLGLRGAGAGSPVRRLAAVREVLFPLLAATATTAVVTLPFLYLDGDLRDAYLPFVLAVVVSLVASLAIALTWTPLLAPWALGPVRRLRRRASGRPSADPFRRGFGRALAATMRRPWIPVLASVLLLGASLWVFEKKVAKGSIFSPEPDTTLRVSLTLPPGSRIDQTDALLREFEDRVLDHEFFERGWLEQVEAFVTETSGFLTVRFLPAVTFTNVPATLKDNLSLRAAAVSGADISVTGDGPGFSRGKSSVSPSYRLRVRGPDWERLDGLTRSVAATLERNPRVKGIDTNGVGLFVENARELVLTPHRDRIAAAGLTVASFVEAVRPAIATDLGTRRWTARGGELSGRVRFAGGDDLTVAELEDLGLRTPAGTMVPVGHLATLSERSLPGEIRRRDQRYERLIDFDYRGPRRVGDRFLRSVVENTEIPPGYELEDGLGLFLTGKQEKQIRIGIVFALLLVTMVSAALFESLVLPFVAMLSVPLSFVAIPFTFWATGESFDRTAYVGLILLAGIAINNALLLVHRAGRLHRRLGDPARAARLAAVERVRPILLTTFTSIAGLVPLLWTGTEAMSATWRSLALSATAGLAASSAFTLFVIPCLFTLLARRGSPRRPVPSDPKGVPA
jgi:multidrug efflux pump subunit AcrB